MCRNLYCLPVPKLLTYITYSHYHGHKFRFQGKVSLYFTRKKITMKKILVLLICALGSFTYVSAQTKAGKIDTAQHQQYYSCPHHQDVVQHEPGKCPKCGMTLGLSTKEQMQAKTSKNYTCPVHADVFKHDAGKCPQCGKKLQLTSKEQMKSSVMKIYTCPMHPEVALDKDGKCPQCGTALVEKKSKS